MERWEGRTRGSLVRGIKNHEYYEACDNEEIVS